mmetsp:Transcript_29300/g.33649  ORF Transcript_29300/g.33649 Transcript_29300/m.33649 type:complete len:149 (+) Transcript_29300:134-580(+)
MASDDYDKMDHASVSLPTSLVVRSIGESLMPSTPSTDNPSETIVKLSIDPVKRTTLCHFKDSMFAKQFNDSDWMLEHTFESNDGNAVLMEFPTAIIKPIINQLRLAAMLESSYFQTLKISSLVVLERRPLVQKKKNPTFSNHSCSTLT